jgi:hypothetical protein
VFKAKLAISESRTVQNRYLVGKSGAEINPSNNNGLIRNGRKKERANKKVTECDTMQRQKRTRLEYILKVKAATNQD